MTPFKPSRDAVRLEIEGVLQELVEAVHMAPISRSLPPHPHAVAETILQIVERACRS